MKYRILSFCLAAALCVAPLSGCGSSTPAPSATQSAPSAATESTPVPETTPSSSPIPAPTPSASATAPAVEIPSVPAKEPSVTPEISAQPSQTPAQESQPPAPPSVSPTPTPTPTPTISEAERILNSAKLSPMKTNDTELDAMVEDILSRITTDSMTTYEKVKACYDYLIENTVYQTKDEATVIRSGIYSSTEDYKTVVMATEALATGKGVCDHYAAALQVLTRRIGLDSYFCAGKHLSQKGGMGGHVWTLITVNGTDYIFDAQIDDTTNGNYSRFCKTFEEMGSRYQDYNVAQTKGNFGNFHRVSSGGSSFIDDFLASDPQLTENAEMAIEYSAAVAAAATALRTPQGLPAMRSAPGAAEVACYCAAAKVMGEPIETEAAANLMVEQGVSFRHVVVISMSGYIDPEELVANEQAAFTNPNFDGFGAGMFEDEWAVIFYGG